MSKLFIFNMMSLDGYFEGPDHDLSWHNVDKEFNDFAIKQLDEIGALLFGRVTYQVMASYWPTEMAIKDDPVVANKMNSVSKIVFSRTLRGADWENTRLVSINAAEEVARLKQQPGKDLAIFGSADLAASLAPAGLIDEYRVMVNPVVLANGTPLFKGISDKQNMTLAGTRTFRSGNVLLTYRPENKSRNPL